MQGHTTMLQLEFLFIENTRTPHWAAFVGHNAVIIADKCEELLTFPKEGVVKTTTSLIVDFHFRDNKYTILLRRIAYEIQKGTPERLWIEWEITDKLKKGNRLRHYKSGVALVTPYQENDNKYLTVSLQPF